MAYKTVSQLVEEAMLGLNSTIYPSEEYTRLLFEHSATRAAAGFHLEEERKLSDLMKISDPLHEFRSLMQLFPASTAETLSRQMEYESFGMAVKAARTEMGSFYVGSVVEEVLKNNRALLAHQNLSDSLLGYSATEQLKHQLDMVSGMEATILLEEIRDRAFYLGEYDFGPESQNVSQEQEDLSSGVESRIILPDDADFQLKRVNYIPISLIQKAMSDPELMRKISPRDFELFVGELIEKLGFSDVSVTPRSNDEGRDIIATKLVNDVPLLFAFECKQYSPKRKIQIATMRSLLGTISHGPTKANIGVLVTTSTFTKGARNFYLSEALLDGKDFNDLVGWLKKVNSNTARN